MTKAANYPWWHTVILRLPSVATPPVSWRVFPALQARVDMCGHAGSLSPCTVVVCLESVDQRGRASSSRSLVHTTHTQAGGVLCQCSPHGRPASAAATLSACCSDALPVPLAAVVCPPAQLAPTVNWFAVSHIRGQPAAFAALLMCSLNYTSSLLACTRSSRALIVFRCKSYKINSLSLPWLESKHLSVTFAHRVEWLYSNCSGSQ